MPPATEYKWELYDLSKDYSQAHDLAAHHPERLKELQALFLKEAVTYQVLPLDNRQFQRAIEPRPSVTTGRTVFTYEGVNADIPLSTAPSLLNRSFTITAEVAVPVGGNGMIATWGGRWGGMGLYLVKGKPVFDYNRLMLEQFRAEGAKPLSAGKHTIEFDFTYDGPGLAKSGLGVLKVDGAEAAKLSVPKTIPFILPVDETFDVGRDTRTGVNDADYKPQFNVNGTIDKLTVTLGQARLADASEQGRIRAAARARD